MDSLYQLHIRLRACVQRGVSMVLFEYSQNRLHSRTRMQNVRSRVVRETVRSESNRPRVLRDQKVLPEDRNRLLLPMVFSAIQSFEILSGSSRGISVLPLPRPIYR